MAAEARLNPFVIRPILGVNVAVSSYDEAIEKCLVWARERQSRTLFFANVHMIMEAVDDPAFLLQLNSAGTVFPDGMPLVWALRALGERNARRVCGPDFTVLMLAAAERYGLPVGFYGGSQSRCSGRSGSSSAPESSGGIHGKPSVPAVDSRRRPGRG